MNNILILIPPSEGKNEGGTCSPLKKTSQDVKYVIDQWQGVSNKEWGKFLGVKEKALDKAIDCNKSVVISKTLPAIERYKGVVYTAIDYATLKKEDQMFFDQHVRIISAVFGFVQPKDLIPNYKCKINHFGADKHWRSISKNYFKNAFVVDLLPQAHKKAVDYANGISIEFSIIKQGKKMPAGHQGKHIKGRFIRWLCEQQSVDEKVLKKFNEDGFQWNDGEFIKRI